MTGKPRKSMSDFTDADAIKAGRMIADGMYYGVVNDNQQLREFVAQLIRFICPEEHQYSCNRQCPAYKKCQGSPKCEFVDWAIERAAELEIEVDE